MFAPVEVFEELDGFDDISANYKLGVVLLCHGSQRGSSKTECSCAWSDGPDSYKWCRDCPSTAKGLVETTAKLQEILCRKYRQKGFP